VTAPIEKPDPSVIASERLQEAKVELRREMAAKHEEAKGWVERLQLLHEEKISRSLDATASLDRVVQTRLAGSETALNAAMAAADKVTQKIEINFGNVMTEMKAGMSKQIDTIKESMDEIKGRLDRGEGGSRLSAEEAALQHAERIDRHGSNQNFLAAIALGVAFLGNMLAIGGWLYTATRPVVPAPAVVYQADPKIQHQNFPLVPTWENFYRIVQ
jgi:hypothetical protein